MTRLSDALKRAAETADTPVTSSAQPATAAGWQFAPEEMIQVPAERPAAEQPVQQGMPPARQERRAAPRPVPIRLGDADRDKLIVSEGIDPALIEQYRHLAAGLHHAQERSGVRSVMVTSAIANEGKTLTATNLALTLSQSYQRRVLLIDADLRRPRLREVFALPSGEGLIDTLARGGRLPVHHVTPTLAVLTAGRVVSDPMSVLVSPAMKQLLDEARDAFDWVVVDTPPIAILPDANLLAAMIDTALLVVSAQSTPYPMVQRAAEAVGTGRILGVVLNRAEQAGLSTYNYGYPGYVQGRAQPKSKRWWRWLSKSRRGPSAAPAAVPSAADRSVG